MTARPRQRDHSILRTSSSELSKPFRSVTTVAHSTLGVSIPLLRDEIPHTAPHPKRKRQHEQSIRPQSPSRISPPPCGPANGQKKYTGVPLVRTLLVLPPPTPKKSICRDEKRSREIDVLAVATEQLIKRIIIATTTMRMVWREDSPKLSWSMVRGVGRRRPKWVEFRKVCK
jgi:hypothetical protein